MALVATHLHCTAAKTAAALAVVALSIFWDLGLNEGMSGTSEGTAAGDHPLTGCSIATVEDAAALPAGKLAALLAASSEPLLVRGLNASVERWPYCTTHAGCVGRYGDMDLGLSTGTSIGSQNPERALDATWATGRMEMKLRDYIAAIESDSLPPETYAFYTVAGTTMAADFAPLRTLFGLVLRAQQPELSALAEQLPDLADQLHNISMRVALGAVGTGSSWHGHGPALLAVAAGSKTWFIRDPARTLPPWLNRTLTRLQGQPPKSTLGWVKAAHVASPAADVPFAWLQHMWHCTQEAGELMYVPPSMRHAIFNHDETFAVGVQTDVMVMGSPLHVAAFHGLVVAAELLLAGGASVSAKASNGGTPLHHASFFGHEGVARLLLAAGAQIDATDKRGDTPLDVATSSGMRALLAAAAQKVGNLTAVA